MLAFFRKYQKIFFLFVTIIIVTSFVFFGTFQAITPIFSEREETLYKTSDGKAITKSYLNDMTRFLAQEPLTMKGFQNFLNDHILAKEFLDTKIGYLLLSENGDQISEELKMRLEKEKLFRPYRHPVRRELSVENVWLTFAQPLHEAYTKHVRSSSAIGRESFENKAQLFLMERRFPGDILSYILRYEEKQSPDLNPDPRLRNDTLALFGYHDLNDWFGPTYVENAAKAIIAGASFAREKGYSVSKEEVSADILLKSERMFQQIKEHSKRWPNAQALYYDCLKMLQMDEPRLMAIMEDILLFRRLFQDVSEQNLVDTFSMKKFYEKAHECIEIEMVTLPGEFGFKTSDDLKKFELYLESVCERGSDLLALPDAFDSLDLIETKAKELVSTGFLVEIAHVSKKECEAKLSLKEMWAWEENHEKTWKAQFPEINSLSEISGEKKAEVDAYACKCIVDEHPEWISEILATKKCEEKSIYLPKNTLEGIGDPEALCKSLIVNGELSSYTQDGENYYSIKVKEYLKKELLTFKEARDLRILDKMLSKVSESHFDPIFDKIFTYAKSKRLTNEFSKDALAALRFVKYMDDVKSNPKIEKALWPLAKKREEIFRYSRSNISFEEAMLPNGKEISISETIGPFFTRYIDHRVENPLPLDKMLIEEKLLSDELKEQLLIQILQKNG